MANIEQKLNQFSSFVLKDAAKQRDHIMKQFENEKKRRIDGKETELLSDAYQDIQSTIASSRRDNNERVLKVEMELKKELLLKREKMIDDVFLRVNKRFNEFIQSKEYEKWLATRVQGALQELGEGKKTVYLTPADMQYSTTLQKKFPSAEFRQSDEDFIGGVKAFNENKQISIDTSIGTMLAEAREKFLQRSGLGIS